MVREVALIVDADDRTALGSRAEGVHGGGVGDAARGDHANILLRPVRGSLYAVQRARVAPEQGPRDGMGRNARGKMSRVDVAGQGSGVVVGLRRHGAAARASLGARGRRVLRQRNAQRRNGHRLRGRRLLRGHQRRIARRAQLEDGAVQRNLVAPAPVPHVRAVSLGVTRRQ